MELQNKSLTLMLAWSSWCQACSHLISSCIKLIPNASELKLKLVNFDINYRELIKLSIKHLPVMILFKDDRPIGIKLGALTAQMLSEWLSQKLR